jgi:proteic killer suppression protein
VDITFATKRLRRLCGDETYAIATLGKHCARQLRARLADLESVNNVKDLVAGKPHPLTGNRKGSFAIRLHGGYRLVFEPYHDPAPKGKDGSIDWMQVAAVRITFIGDYHDEI